MLNKFVQSQKKIYLFGFSRWKHAFVRVFLKEYDPKKIFFVNPLFSSHLSLALKKGLDVNSEVFIWGKRAFVDVENFCMKNNLQIVRVEDGFIRSVGLGSDLTRPYSLVLDRSGIYFDPNQESDLENVCNSYNFDGDRELINRAEALRVKILQTKISKYNADSHKRLSFDTQRRVALVTGQVEDDASIRLGGDGMTNLELLKSVKKSSSDAYIVFKPHPDVLSGNRVGDVPTSEALKYCNEVVKEVSMASLLESVDEVHTICSLTGFEALMYEKKVVCYGLPFYAGWGLTEDKKSISRRKRELTLAELVAATLLLYPRYINPQTLELSTAEDVLEALEAQKKRLDGSAYLHFEFKMRNSVSRVGQKFLSWVA